MKYILLFLLVPVLGFGQTKLIDDSGNTILPTDGGSVDFTKTVSALTAEIFGFNAATNGYIPKKNGSSITWINPATIGTNILTGPQTQTGDYTHTLAGHSLTMNGGSYLIMDYNEVYVGGSDGQLGANASFFGGSPTVYLRTAAGTNPSNNVFWARTDISGAYLEARRFDEGINHRLSVTQNGVYITDHSGVTGSVRVIIDDLPVFANNAAAALSLPVGSLYRTSSGVLMITY